MNDTFRAHVESLLPAFKRLVAMRPVNVRPLPTVVPERGIYLFSEGRRHLYVGRTNRMGGRLREHCRPSSTHGTAHFAFILAREATGRTYVSCSRAELAVEPGFMEAFRAAKERVSRMHVRFVEERDPIRQALLEVYTAVALKTPHNSFENH